MGEYDSLLIEIKLKHTERAKEIIPKLCYTLKKEDPLLSDKDIGEWVKRDLIDIWSRTTIYENLPEEFKDLEKSGQTKEGIKQKKVRERTPTASDVQKQNQTTEKSTPAPEYKRIELSTNGQSIARELELKPEQEPDPEPEFDPDIPVKLPDLAWHQNENDEREKDLETLRLENAKFKESIAQKDSQIKEMSMALNKFMANKKESSKVEETPEYQEMKSRALIAEEERDELKQVITRDIKKHPEQTFQSAATIPQTKEEPKENSRISGDLEVEFPGKELSTFFMDVRNVKNIMYLQIKGNKVTGWQSDYAREKENARIRQS